MQKKLLLIFQIVKGVALAFFTLISVNSSAQSTSTLTGTIIDALTKSPIELASVQLIKGNIIIITTVTDRKGKFKLQKVIPGQYFVAYTFVGYEKKIDTISISAQRILLGVIELSSSATEMRTVEVSTKKALLSSSIERKIYNVGQDILAESGSASDLLKNVPSVEVDIDGNVSLRGSTGVLVLINGRPSPQMGKSRAEVLEEMPANMIDRIEVITNPSAKYKPDGTAGIINIVMKKNTKSGFNGTVIANVGTKDRYNGGVNLNYKPGKLNLYTNYSIRQDSRTRINMINRQVIDSTGKINGYYYELNQSVSKPISQKATIGAEYEVNSNNSIGALFNYSYRYMKKEDAIDKFFYTTNQNLIQQYTRLRYDPETEIESNATFSWQHNFIKEGHEIHFEYNKAQQDEDQDNHYTNLYNFPAKPTSYDNTLIKHSNHEDHFTIDYVKPISDKAKLEAGYDGSITGQKPIYAAEYFDTSLHKFVPDLLRSNKFIYQQSIHAFYGTYQYSYGKFSYLAGLRIENTDIDANLVTKDSIFENHFFKLYPTLHISYKLAHGEIQLNYSRRVNRPEADDLNPFPDFRDPRNLKVGNPKLLPEIINSVEFGYKYQDDKFSFVPSIYYRYKQFALSEVVTKLNDSTLLTTQQNLSNDQSSGIELIFAAKPVKILSANLNANFFYNSIDASSVGFSKTQSIISMSANFIATLTITPHTIFQVSSIYRSATLTPQGRLFASFVFNSGVRQDLFKKKISITLTGSDLLKTFRLKSEISTPFLNQTIVSKRDSQIFYLGITYHFGRLLRKAIEEKMQFDNGM